MKNTKILIDHYLTDGSRYCIMETEFWPRYLYCGQVHGATGEPTSNATLLYHRTQDAALDAFIKAIDLHEVNLNKRSLAFPA